MSSSPEADDIVDEFLDGWRDRFTCTGFEVQWQIEKLLGEIGAERPPQDRA